MPLLRGSRAHHIEFLPLRGVAAALQSTIRYASNRLFSFRHFLHAIGPHRVIGMRVGVVRMRMTMVVCMTVMVMAMTVSAGPDAFDVVMMTFLR